MVLVTAISIINYEHVLVKIQTFSAKQLNFIREPEIEWGLILVEKE
jgi:hypothetical protein